MIILCSPKKIHLYGMRRAVTVTLSKWWASFDGKTFTRCKNLKIIDNCFFVSARLHIVNSISQEAWLFAPLSLIWPAAFIPTNEKHRLYWVTLFRMGNTLLCGWRFDPTEDITIHVVQRISSRYSWCNVS